MPAKSEPIMTVLAPAAKALTISPLYLMPPSAIVGMPRRRATSGAIHDGRKLRDADTGDDARRADTARTDSDLHRIDAGFSEGFHGLRRSRCCRRSNRN